ncbi:MAG TPA: retropepsin-like aspartic protease [Anseongella sp.]|nr:retropepsin-like aspartic protease [Anseongella sp.]
MRKLYAPRFLFFAGIFFLLAACNTAPSPGLLFPEDREIDTLKFNYTSGHLSVNVEIKGETYDFLYDSGASSTLLHEDIPTAKIIKDSVYFTDVFGNAHLASQVMLDTLQLGKMKFAGLNKYYQRDANLEGILGGNILRRLVWKINFARQEIYVAKSIRSFRANTAGGVPFKLRKSCPHIKCTINGVEMYLMLDTGFDGFTSINKRALDTLAAFRKEVVPWHGVSNVNTHNPFAEDNYSPTLDSSWYSKGQIEAGSRILRNEIIAFSSLPSTLIGLDFLKRFDEVILDYPGKMLYLGKETLKSYGFFQQASLNMNTLGIQLSEDSIPLISRISPLAGNKGLRLNDTIIEVDGYSFINTKPVFQKVLWTGYEKGKVKKIEQNIPLRKIIVEKFNKMRLSSLVKIKRGDSILSVELKRLYHFKAIPDTLLDYYIPDAFWIMGGSAYANRDSLGGSSYTFVPEKPPADLFGWTEGNVTDSIYSYY